MKRPSSSDLVDYAMQVLTDFDGRRLTLRQIYYQLIARQIIQNRQTEYKRLGHALTVGRRDGRVPFNAIEDRTRVPANVYGASSLPVYVNAMLRQYRRSIWSGQETYVEVWLEKQALAGIFEPIVEEYNDVPLIVGRGYASLSALYEAAGRMSRHQQRGRSLHIAYFGDFDPSGEDIVRALRESLKNDFGLDPTIEKVSLTMEQIRRYNLPPDPAKTTDTRAAAFIAQHGDNVVELDALPPDTLEELIRDAVESVLDMAAVQEMLARQEMERTKLAALAARVGGDAL